MRTPEGQELLNFGRSGKGGLDSQNGRLLRIGCLFAAIVLIIVAAWIGVRWLGRLVPQVIAKDQRSYPYGYPSDAGYTVAKYRWAQSGFRVQIWADPSLDLRFEVPYFDLVRVKAQRWLAADRVILIGLDYVYHDSGDSTGEAWLLYDFERGELRSCGRAWHVRAPEQAKERNMSCADLTAFANQLK